MRTPSVQDQIARADQLRAAIAVLQQEIQQIEANGEVAPLGCRVMRYKVKTKNGCYWYYKLQALEPIFPTGLGSDKLSKYKRNRSHPSNNAIATYPQRGLPPRGPAPALRAQKLKLVPPCWGNCAKGSSSQ